MPQTLQILGSYGATVSIRFARIVHDFGQGYTTKANTGHSAGLRFLRLSYDFLPNEGSLTVTDPENGNAVTNWSTYLWRFFRYRMTDGEAFNIVYDDPDTGPSTTLLVEFAESQLDFDWFNFKLYSTGILLRQYRALS